MNMQFGYYARVLYDTETDTVAMQSYNLNGQPLGTPRMVKAGKLPTLLFQLVDAGYLVEKVKQDGRVTCIVAFSEMWLKDMQARHDMVR